MNWSKVLCYLFEHRWIDEPLSYRFPAYTVRVCEREGCRTVARGADTECPVRKFLWWTWVAHDWHEISSRYLGYDLVVIDECAGCHHQRQRSYDASGP